MAIGKLAHWQGLQRCRHRGHNHSGHGGRHPVIRKGATPHTSSLPITPAPGVVGLGGWRSVGERPLLVGGQRCSGKKASPQLTLSHSRG